MKFVAAKVLLITALFASEAMAQHMTWQFRNQSGEFAMMELYSRSRQRHVWPGNRNVFYIPADGQVHTYAITCIAGEYICYGAWVAREPNTIWGVGRGGRQGCADCCSYCDGGEAPVRNLVGRNRCSGHGDCE